MKELPVDCHLAICSMWQTACVVVFVFKTDDGVRNGRGCADEAHHELIGVVFANITRALTAKKCLYST